MRATSVAFLPSVRLYTPAGKVSAALSPDENPFDPGSLAAVAEKSNSRFFTDCYHEAAAIEPPGRRKPRGVSGCLGVYGTRLMPRGAPAYLN
jgi:hypothetical protein